ncbi:MAG: type II secretion system F family protein [Chloroflexota bacterium]|nr:MAG: type II secretion system F family protein [Chloroflexota bacterium]
MAVLWIILGILVIGAVVLVIIGLRSPDKEDPLMQRLAEFAEAGKPIDLEEIELSQPFAERIIYPVARRFGEIVLKFTPQNAIQDTIQKLEMAGSPRGIDPTLFFAGRLAGLSLGGLFLFLSKIAPEGSFLKGKGILIAIPAALVGFYIPELLLRSRITRRQKEIRKAMPDALDLLTICVEAGLGFDAAMAKVYEKWDNELGRAFGRVIREIQLGKLRREALRDMADRLGIAEMTSFVAAVIQSEQLGVSMAHVLRIQSDQMRVKRRQHAEEEAHKAPIKMLLPMVLLIFPSICIVLMTPAILIIATSGFGR